MDPNTSSVGSMGGILAVIIQGGSFALLCFIVYWLTQWVPKRVERYDTIREAEAKSREAVADNLRKSTEAQGQAFVASIVKLNEATSEQLRYEREACDRRFAELIKDHDDMMTHLMKHYELSREIRHEVANIAQHRANERVLQEQRRTVRNPANHNPVQQDSSNPTGNPGKEKEDR